MTKRKKTSVELFRKETPEPDKRKYVLRLYVAGMSRQSKQAIENITRICDDNLKGRYDLQIIDIYQRPHLAAGCLFYRHFHIGCKKTGTVHVAAYDSRGSQDNNGARMYEHVFLRDIVVAGRISHPPRVFRCPCQKAPRIR